MLKAGFVSKSRRMQLVDDWDIPESPLENYSVEQAIARVRKLGNQLVAATEHTKHHFRSEWVEGLVNRYSYRPGKPIVHLDDLSDTVMPILDDEARGLVRESLNAWVRQQGISRARPEFGNIATYAMTLDYRPAKLRKWRRFSELTGFQVNSLERHVTSLRNSGGARTGVVDHPRLPMNLATPWGAKLIGYRLDANYRTSAFTNKNPVLHEDYRRAVSEVVGNIQIRKTKIKGSSFTPGIYLRTNVGNLVTMLMTVAGLDNTRDQRKANNPVPLWLFLCSTDIIAAFLAALWDAEGSVHKRDLKLRQAVELLRLKSGMHIPYWPDSVHLKELDASTYDQVLEHPPRILTSTALLLAGLGIACHVTPERLSDTRNGISAYWQLRIMRNDSVRTFYELVRLLSLHKERRLRLNVESMRWKWRKMDGFPRKAS